MPTIKDVALLAGVSVSAVSKVLNGYSDIGEETKARILRAVRELQYTPNAIAKKLSQKQSRTIGLIMANFTQSDGKDGIHFQIMRGAYAAAEKTEYEIVAVAGMSPQQQRQDYDSYCAEHKFAGVIIQGLRLTDPYYEQIKQSKYPTVAIDLCAIAENLSTVGVDNVQAADAAVSFLVKQGRRTIGMVNGSSDAAVSVERLRGYYESLQKHGLEISGSAVIDCGFSEQQAYDSAESFLAENSQLDAVFCASDLMAIGFVRRCRELGKLIPEDLAIIGFDNIVLGSYTMPRLTTVGQDIPATGSQAFKTLTEMIKLKKHGARIVMPHAIFCRESA